MKLKIGEDGSARAHGAMRIPDADSPAVLVAIPGSAEATCADLDGDGDAGLSGLTIQFKHPSTSGVVPFVLVPDGEDIGASGTYPVRVSLAGGAPVTGEVEVRVVPERRERRG